MHPQSAQNLLIAFAGSFLLFMGGCKPDPVPDPDPSGCEGSPSAVPAANEYTYFLFLLMLSPVLDGFGRVDPLVSALARSTERGAKA